AKKEGCEPSYLEQFRFHLRKDKSDKLSSEAVEQVYDKACKRLKTLCQHLRVLFCLKIMLHWKTSCIHKCLALKSMEKCWDIDVG
ncbi:hypothetical protein Gohar_000615, partial [Gossypium harknessii]|nr:hypothetical protein [Gossypium harknessii]